MNKQIVVLNILAKAGREMTGLEIVEASNKKVGMGSIYVVLAHLQEHGEVESRIETHEELMERFQKQQIPLHFPLPRRFYRITTGGRKRLIEEEKPQLDPGGLGLQGT